MHWVRERMDAEKYAPLYDWWFEPEPDAPAPGRTMVDEQEAQQFGAFFAAHNALTASLSGGGE